MNSQQLVGLREAGDAPALITQLQDLCTWLCVGGEQYVHQFEVFPYTAALLPLVTFPDAQVQILALRALALEVEQVPRGVTAVSKDNGIPILLERASNLNFLDPTAESISEEIIKILAVLSTGAHKAMVQHNAIPVVLQLASSVPSEAARFSCYNCVSSMVSVCTVDNRELLLEAMIHVVDVLGDKVSFLAKVREGMQGASNGQQVARALADEQIVLVIVKCLCHLVDRVGLTPIQLEEVLDHPIISPAVPLLLHVLELTAHPLGSDTTLQRAVLSFFASVFQSAPRTLIRIMSSVGGWEAVVACVASMATSATRHSSHAAPDAASLTGLTFTMTQNNAATTGRSTGLEAALERDGDHLALLDFLLLILPAIPEEDRSHTVLTRPYHSWSWEDDFHNVVEYDDNISWRLEREYQRQRAVGGGRFIPCEVVHMIRYFVSFERMRQLTPQGSLSRTVMRSPILANFLHTRSAASVGCTCQSAYSNNNSFSIHPTNQSMSQVPSPRASPKEAEPSKGWFSSLFGCCCTADSVKEAPKRRKRGSMISALDASAPLSVFRFDEVQQEVRDMLDGCFSEGDLKSLLKPVLDVAQRTANPLILRQCCEIVLRLLALANQQCVPASGRNSVSDYSARQDPTPGAVDTNAAAPFLRAPNFLIELSDDLANVFAYAVSVCSTSQVERLLAVMSAKDLAAEGFEESSTVPVHNYLASPSVINDNDPLTLVVTYSIIGDLLHSACGAICYLVPLLGPSVATKLTSLGCVADLTFLGKHLQTTPGLSDTHCPRHSSKLFCMKNIMDTIHDAYNAIQAGTRQPAEVPVPVSPVTALPVYHSVSFMSTAAPPNEVRDDAACPVVLRPLWKLASDYCDGGALETSAADGCPACAAIDALRSGRVSKGGAASGHQALIDYFGTPDGDRFKLGLQRFAVRLMRDISHRIPLPGTFVADSFNISKGPLALSAPNSITSAVLMDKALKPIGLRILPLLEPPAAAALQQEEAPATLSIPGYAPMKLMAIPRTIREFTLHTFAFATISQIAEEIATRYNDSIDSAFPGMLQRPHDDWIAESISTMHDVVPPSVASNQRRRSPEPDEADILHPNRFPPSDNSGDTTPMIDASSPANDSPDTSLNTPHWPRIQPKQILLLINRVPLLDRSMSFLDTLLRNELTAGGMRRLLESTPTQYNRALVQQALTLWNHTYRLTFVVLEAPLDASDLPTEYGCHCGLVQEQPTTVVDTPVAGPPVSADAAASSTGDPSVILVRPPTSLYKVDQPAVCSPWHLFADKDLQDHWVIDTLRLLEQLIELVVTPFEPTLLAAAGQRLYSTLLHNCKLQTVGFMLPALAHIVNPSIRPTQHALSPSTPRGADGLAEYILWNHPSVFPLPIRILYFNYISGVRGSAASKSVGKGGGGRVVGGGGWVLPARNRSQTSSKKIKVSVKRDALLADADEILTTYALCPLPLDIEFEGEPGSGVGPTIEFFSLVAKELTAYSSEMWASDAAAGASPSPVSSPVAAAAPQFDDNPSFTDSSLVYDEKAEKRQHTVQYASGRLFPRFPPTPRGIRNFALLGHLIARGLQDGRTMGMWLHPVFLDRLLGKGLHNGEARADSSASNVFKGSMGSSTSLHGGVHGMSSKQLSNLMNKVDPQMEQSLQSLLAMSESDLKALDIVFTVPGTNDTVQLCPGGLEKEVTGDNVNEYCDAARYTLCCTAVDIPGRVVLEGLNRSNIIPGHMRLFVGSEFEVLLSGHRGKVWATQEQLRRDITCAHGYNAHSQAIQFFVAAVVGFSAELQRRFLLFISGSDCLPAGGLNPPIQIVRKGLDPEASPIRKRRVKGGSVSPSVGPTTATSAHNTPQMLSLGTPTPSIPTPISITALHLPPPQAIHPIALGSTVAESESTTPISTSRSQNVDEGAVTPSRVNLGEEEVSIRLTTQEQVDECLPTVNTCFHYLKLPDYSSEEVLRNRLLVAVYEGQGTFMLS